jgi:hypothetical protein
MLLSLDNDISSVMANVIRSLDGPFSELAVIGVTFNPSSMQEPLEHESSKFLTN